MPQIELLLTCYCSRKGGAVGMPQIELLLMCYCSRKGGGCRDAAN